MGVGLGGAFLASTRMAPGLRSQSVTGEIRGFGLAAISNVLAKFSLELEMDFSRDWKEGDGRLGGVSEMGVEDWLWNGQVELVGESFGGDRGGRIGEAGGSGRKGERGAGMADR